MGELRTILTLSDGPLAAGPNGSRARAAGRVVLRATCPH
jgi:hypothetical protein